MVTREKPLYPATLARHDSLGIREILNFRDNENSRLIFLVDGFFLLAESFFWLVTLFLLAHQSFSRLGVMVLSLAVIFGVIFYLLKNTIDRLGRNRIYRLSVVLYALSWALRALTEGQMSLEVLYLFLVGVTFCTSFFRLAMNKRFYDLAKLTLSHDYLVLKSYYTQFAIVFIFGVMAFAFAGMENTERLLTPIYWAAAILSLVYLAYGARRYASSASPRATV